MLDLGVLGFYFEAWGTSNPHLRIEYLIFNLQWSDTMIFIVSWCHGGLAMVVFILFWQGSYPTWCHHTGIISESVVE